MLLFTVISLHIETTIGNSYMSCMKPVCFMILIMYAQSQLLLHLLSDYIKSARVPLKRAVLLTAFTQIMTNSDVTIGLVETGLKNFCDAMVFLFLPDVNICT